MLLLCCFVVLLNVGTNNGFIKVNYTTTESKIIGVLWRGIQKQINRSTTSGRAYWWGQGENTHDMFMIDICVRVFSLYKQIII